MSTLLERMVQRTRGPLSSVEPVAPPPFGTAGAMLSGGFADEAQGVAEVSEALADARRLRPGDSPSYSLSAAQTPQPPDSIPPPTIAPSTVDAGGERPLLDRADRRPAAVTPADHRGDATRPAARDSAQPASPAKTRATAEAKPAEERITGAATSRARAHAKPQRSTAERPAPVARAADGDDAGPGSAPGVTISIGHIEVRAAPAAQPAPAPAPFRPQVSLADFLERQDRRR